jgi:NADPH:quinone reductase-like Zn-dependent oxidoreductase
MKAITQDSYGSADALALSDVDQPVAGADEVLVRVHAAGLDRGVWHLTTGLPYLVRVMGFGFRAPKNPVPGSDVAGVVEAVGTNVTRFGEGDEVYGIAKGSYAEYAVAEEAKLAPKPTNLTFEQAAVVPVSAITALHGVRDQGSVRGGQSVLVVGASGGVGSFAVQIAKAFGAEVTGVASASKVDLVREIGADKVIDYTRDDFTEMDERYDVILDMGGRRSLSRLRRALTPEGTLVIVGGEGGNRWTGGFGRSMRAPLLSPLVSQKLKMFVAPERHEDLEFLTGLIEDGKVTPVIDRTYSLAEVPEAVRYMAEGKARGKVAITVW